MTRPNPFCETPRANLTMMNGVALLRWLVTQEHHTTRLTNAKLAAEVGIGLDEGRPQSRRLSEALEALRHAELIEVSYEPAHPKKSPAGRVIKLTEKGFETFLSNS